MDYDWIKKRHGLLDESGIDAKISEFGLENAGRIAIHSNKHGVKAEVKDAGQLLELRVFDSNRELRLMRNTLGAQFFWRLAEGIFDNERTFSLYETQLLDKDDKHSHGCEYKSTAGGIYELPGNGYSQVHIVNYFTYDEETGNLQYADFRIQSFS